MHLLEAVIAFTLLGSLNGKPTKVIKIDPNVVNPEFTHGDERQKPGEYDNGNEFTEGDMKVKNGNSDDRNAITGEDRYWPNGVVPYVLDSSLSSGVLEEIKKSLADFAKYTCIEWIERTEEEDFVDISARSDGCNAALGYYGGNQSMNLEAACNTKGTVIHEMLHALGFEHEQARNDRDEYIIVNWENLKPGWLGADQFKKMSNENSQDLPYDYSSVMHYADWAFSSNGKPVFTTKDPSKQDMVGQRNGFSKQDIEEVNKLYKCPEKTASLNETSIEQSATCYDQSASYCEPMVKEHAYACSGPENKAFQEYCYKSCGLC